MYDIVTYTLRNQNLNSDDFYKDLKLFTDEVLNEIDSLENPLLDSFQAYLSGLGYEKSITREECILELLMLGIYWQSYSGDALELEELPCQLLNKLAEMRRQNDQMKTSIDFLRGILSTLFLSPVLYDTSAVTALTVSNLDKLLNWLSAAGDFNHEVRRLRIWKDYFYTLPADVVIEDLAAAITLAIWFEEYSEKVLGCYTPNVDCFLKSIHPEHYWKEDVIFCGKREVEYHLNMVGAEIMNRAFRKDFLSKKYRVVVVPGCLRLLSEGECKATPDVVGYKCSCCTKNCRVCELTLLGRKYNFDTLIVPHESSFSSISNNSKLFSSDTGVVGIACVLNLISGGWMLKDLGISAQCVIMDYCGCKKHWHEKGIPTDINVDQLKLILEINKVE